jgi:ATP-dependent phosphofructokinase / diphosphate-dependent phosphofructokinase
MPPAGNVLIAQGGGPTPVINASLYGLVRAAASELDAGCRIWGARNGISGVLQDRWIDLRRVSGDEWQEIARSPGAALGSCRKMLTPEEARESVKALERMDVRYFFYIGGNDSMDTALKMDRAARDLRYEMACCGIPKTIDNDLPGTDHCPGFGSAARYIAQSTLDLGMDVRSLPTPVSIIEVMGRDAGWLTAATLLARSHADDAPHLIYVPERPLTRERFLEDIGKCYGRLGWVVAAVSEGVRDGAGESWSAPRAEETRDGFGHSLPGDVAARLATLVTRELGLRARSEKPGLLGRASALLVSPRDRREAEEVGAFAFSWALKGNTGFMASIERQPGSSYEAVYGAVPLEFVANKTRLLPEEYMAPGGNDIRAEYRAYVEPLIGEPLVHYATLDVVE